MPAPTGGRKIRHPPCSRSAVGPQACYHARGVAGAASDLIPPHALKRGMGIGMSGGTPHGSGHSPRPCVVPTPSPSVGPTKNRWGPARAIGLSKLAARSERLRGTTRLVGLPHPVGPSSPVQDCTQQPCNRGPGKMAWLDRGPTATKLRGDEVPWPSPCRQDPGLLAAVRTAT